MGGRVELKPGLGGGDEDEFGAVGADVGEEGGGRIGERAEEETEAREAGLQAATPVVLLDQVARGGAVAGPEQDGGVVREDVRGCRREPVAG